MVQEDAVAKALRTKPTGLKIPGRCEQPIIQPITKASTQLNAQPNTKKTSNPIPQPRNSPTSQPRNNPKDPSQETTKKPSLQTRNNPTSQPRTKTSSQQSSQPSSQKNSQPNSQKSSQGASSQLENRKVVNLCQPFVTPRPTGTSYHKSFTKYKPEAPQHTSFNLAAYKAAKDLQRK